MNIDEIGPLEVDWDCECEFPIPSSDNICLRCYCRIVPITPVKEYHPNLEDFMRVEDVDDILPITTLKK